MRYAKAIVGALVAGCSSLVQALDSGGVSAQEALIAAVATLTALGAVWAVPNRTTP